MNSRRGWSQQEDGMLRELVSTMGVRNWTEVASRLAQARHEKPRTGKQCRQRWHNHLNPEITVNKEWDPEEQQKLFALHAQFGNKWTDIARQMPGRTDNAIKNYFYSTIRRSLRRMGKFVGSKNSTESMKKIKPSILSKIFSADSEVVVSGSMSAEEQQLRKYVRETCEHVKEEIIRFTHFKPTRQQKADQAEKNNFERTIEKLEHINKVYEKIRANEIRRRNEELMFGRDYNRMEDSEESEHCDDEEIGSVDLIAERKATVVRTRRAMAASNSAVEPHKHEESKPPAFREEEAEGVKKMVLGGEEPREELEGGFDNPEFEIEIKEDPPLLGLEKMPSGLFTPAMQNYGSPGFYFGTPSMNPFMFQSPEAPMRVDMLSSLQGVGGMNPTMIDDCRLGMQREIEAKMNGEDKRGMNNSTSTFGGSPGSAFRQFGF